jgi:hypothetical protein
VNNIKSTLTYERVLPFLGKNIESLFKVNLSELSVPYFEVIEWDDLLGISMNCLFDEPMTLGFPSIPELNLLLGAPTDGDEFQFIAYLYPEIALELSGVDIGIQFPLSLFKTVEKFDGEYVPIQQADAKSRQLIISLKDVYFYANSDGNIEFSLLDDSVPLSFNHPFMIGDSGVVIEADKIELVQSDDDSEGEIPGGGFGVLIPEARVHLPASLSEGLAPTDLEIKDFAIGGGGFSGEIASNWSGKKPVNLLGMDIGLKKVALDFKQNALIGSEIEAELTIPGFGSKVEVDVGFDLDGNLSLTLATTSGPLELSVDGVLKISVDSFGFERKGDDYMIALGGDVEIKVDALSGLPRFKIERLYIDGQGNISIEGGWLDLSKQYSVDFHGFQLEITKIGFGKEDDGARWIGFSAGVKLVDGLPLSGSVEGLRIYYDDNGFKTLTFNGIGVEFEAPGTLRFKGEVSYDDQEDEFRGQVALNLLPLGLTMDAVLVVGSDSEAEFNYFYIYLNMELPAGIPLYSSGLALYGLAGLFADEMAPDKKDDQEWYDWFREQPIGVTGLDKWTSQAEALAVGAGVTLGTLSDNGYAFSSRALLLIEISGPLIIMEARAQILRKRASLSANNDPPLTALMVIDGRAGTFLFNVDATYRLPESNGLIIDSHAGAEAFFAGSDDWHFYLGEKDPREKRVRARIFQLLQAESYFMLDQDHIAMGARVQFGKKWSCGPVRAGLEALIEGGASLGWRPAHFSGYLWLYGSVGLRVFGFGFNLSAEARIEVDTPDPFRVLVALAVKINLPWFLPDITVRLRLLWGEGGSLPVPLPLKEIAIGHLKIADTWPTQKLPIYDTDGDGIRDDNKPADPDEELKIQEAPVVPLDALPILTFERPMDDITGLHGDPMAPESETIGEVDRRYQLKELVLNERAKGSTTWQKVPAQGQWQAAGDDQPLSTKLILGSKNGFDWLRAASLAWPLWFLDVNPQYPCLPPVEPELVCVKFDNFSLGPLPPVFILGGLLLATSGTLEIVAVAGEGTNQAVQLGAGGTILHVFFQRAVTRAIIHCSFGMVTVAAYHENTKVVERSGVARIEVEQKNADGEPMPIDRLEVGGRGESVLHKICYLTIREHEKAATAGTVNRQVKAGVDDWYSAGLLLAPYCDYWLEVKTNVIEAAKGTAASCSNEWNAVGQFDERAYFRTQGPPGMVQLEEKIQKTSTGQKEFQHPLTDLSPYVHPNGWTIPGHQQRPHPGDPPRPVYRGYDVGVVFNENYVKFMYRLVGRDLTLDVFDNQHQPVHDAQGRLVRPRIKWGEASRLILGPHDNLWLSSIESASCASVNLDKVTRSDKAVVGGCDMIMRPETLHEIQVTPLLLFDDFHSGDLTQWDEPVAEGDRGGDPDWRVRSMTEQGQTRYYLTQTSNHHGESDNPVEKPGTYVTRGELWWSDYRFSVDLGTGDDDALGVMFRFQDHNNYYRFSMDKGRRYRRLIKKVGGITEELAVDAVPYERDRVYQVMVEVVENQINLFIDGNAIFSVNDNSLGSGKIGLYCWGNEKAVFDEVRVDDLSNSISPLYRFELITSKFVNFFHHIHSFRDRIWARDLAVELSASGLSELNAYAADALSGPKTLPVEKLYALFGLNPPTALSAVGVSLVKADGVRYGLLLESPEPIRWERVNEALVERADRQLAPASPAGTLKLTSLRMPPTDADLSFDPNSEYVDILLQDDLNPTGAIIQHLRRPGSPEPVVKERTLFRDTFAGGMEAWATVDEGDEDAPSSWKISRGRLRQTSNIHGSGNQTIDCPGTFVLAGDENWKDYRLVVEMRSNDNDAIGVMFRYRNEDNYYRFSMDSERRYRRLVRKNDGNVQLLFEDTLPFETGHTYTLVVDAFGNRLDVWLDGNKVLGIVDTSPKALAQGRIGLYAWGNDDACFESVEVKEIPYKADLLLSEDFDDPNLAGWEIRDEGKKQAPSNWSVSNGVLDQTSDIHGDGADPAELPGTYAITGDISWEDYRFSVLLQSDDDDAIGVMFRYRDENNYYRFSMDSQRAYRRLIRKSNGAVSVLWQDAHSYHPGRTHHLIVDVFADRISISMDGAPILNIRDVNAESLFGGKIGLYTWDNNCAHFKQVRVSRSVPPEKVLFHDTFDNGLTNWLIADEGRHSPAPAWEILDGALWQKAETHGGSLNPGPDHADKPGTFVIYKDRSWGDHSLSVWLRSDGEYAIGIMARFRDTDNYCRFSMDRRLGYRRLIEKVQGNMTTLWEDDIKYKPGHNYKVEMLLEGNQVRLRLDGIDLCVRQISNRLSAGKIGLYSWGNASACFERVLVTAKEVRTRILLEDNFDGFDHNRWSVVALTPSRTIPDWRVVKGSLCQFADHPGTAVINGQEDWIDYSYSVIFRISRSGATGVTFGFKRPDNAYYLILDAMHSRLIKRAGRQSEVLWEGPPIEYSKSWHELVLRVSSDFIDVRRGRHRLLRIRNSENEGAIGLCTWNTDSASFSAVSVTKKVLIEAVQLDEKFETGMSSWTVFDEGEPSPMSEWSIIDGYLRHNSETHGGSLLPWSPHKPGTYVFAGDRSWTDYRFIANIRSTRPYGIGVMFRYQDADNYYRFSMNNQLGYRRLTKMTNGHATVLWQDSVPYKVNHKYLMTVDVFDDVLRVYLDGVQVCRAVDRSLRSGGIALYCWGNNGAHFEEVTVLTSQFADYHVFEEKRRWPAGTVFRIHSGTAPQSTENDLLEHRYRRCLADPGEPRLSAAGTVMRILNTNGEEAHLRTFLPSDAYTPVPAPWLVGDDGTAACILFPNDQGDVGLIPGGHYRFRFTFLLKSENPKLPVLSRAGISDPEVATIAFTLPHEDPVK